MERLFKNLLTANVGRYANNMASFHERGIQQHCTLLCCTWSSWLQEKKTGLPPPVPQPIGPDPLEWQQTEDFPEGTRLTIDQADLLLSGRGFH